MKRFLVDSLEGELARVEGERLHHLARVLRLRPGDALEVFDGRGGCRAGKIVSVEAEAAIIELGDWREAPAPIPLTLGQGLAKADRFDWVVQKATELGVGRVVPLALERSVVRLDPAKAVARRKRWERIAEEASRQSERSDLPVIDPPLGLEAFLDAARERGERIALLWEVERDGPRLGDWVQEQQGAPLALVVGPEGGITEAEASLARERGAAIVGLGPRVLRTETAGVLAVAIALHRMGELG